MGKAVNLRLNEQQVERLEKAAAVLGCSPTDAAQLLLDEALRRCEHPQIERRHTVVGPQSYIKGTRLAVWHVAMLADQYDDDPDALAEYFEIPVDQIKGALAYAEAYADEIQGAISENRRAVDELPSLPGYVPSPSL